MPCHHKPTVALDVRTVPHCSNAATRGSVLKFRLTQECSPVVLHSSRAAWAAALYAELYSFTLLYDSDGYVLRRVKDKQNCKEERSPIPEATQTRARGNTQYFQLPSARDPATSGLLLHDDQAYSANALSISKAFT